MEIICDSIGQINTVKKILLDSEECCFNDITHCPKDEDGVIRCEKCIEKNIKWKICERGM